VIRTIGMAARFDAVLEVTLDELRIELLYPADEVAEEFFRTLRTAERGERGVTVPGRVVERRADHGEDRDERER
jgi:hypothetical protein